VQTLTNSVIILAYLTSYNNSYVVLVV